MSLSALDRPVTETLTEEQPHAQALQETLLNAIWGIARRPRRVISPLIEFYLARISIIDQHVLRIRRHQDVADIVDFVRQGKGKKRGEIAHDIAAARPKWLGQPTLSDHEAIDLAIRLWLLIDPESMQNDDATIVDQVALQFPRASGGVHLKEFELHFDAEFLRKVAGVTIIGTSSLTEHLLYDKRRKVLILFDLADFLSCSRSLEEENTYPSGFLLETKKTLALLHPQDRIYSDYARRRHPRADIEMTIHEEFPDTHDPQSYVYWRERLLILHEAYQKAQPGKLTQFWRDRRDTNQWTTLWLAVLVIFLTLVFGLIQSITGILQLVITYRQS